MRCTLQITLNISPFDVQPDFICENVQWRSSSYRMVLAWFFVFNLSDLLRAMANPYPYAHTLKSYNAYRLDVGTCFRDVKYRYARATRSSALGIPLNDFASLVNECYIYIFFSRVDNFFMHRARRNFGGL